MESKTSSCYPHVYAEHRTRIHQVSEDFSISAPSHPLRFARRESQYLHTRFESSLGTNLLSLGCVDILRSYTLCLVGVTEEAPYRFWGCANLRLGGNLVPAVRAAIRLLEPLLDAVVAEDMFTLGQSKRCLIDALWVRHIELVVADDAGCFQSVSPATSIRNEGFNLLLSLSGRVSISTLWRDEMALLDATRLLVIWPRKS